VVLLRWGILLKWAPLQWVLNILRIPDIIPLLDHMGSMGHLQDLTDLPQDSMDLPRGSTALPRILTDLPRDSMDLPQVNMVLPQGSTELLLVPMDLPQDNMALLLLEVSIPHSLVLNPSILLSLGSGHRKAARLNILPTPNTALLLVHRPLPLLLVGLVGLVVLLLLLVVLLLETIPRWNELFK
jgi:hypothetical protein